jgi:mannitol-1-phosphate 5-dehydrogenase
VLGKVAPAIAKSISRRKENGFTGTANVLACENAIGGTTVLKNFVLGYLNEEEKEYLEEHIGFPDCAIDGIIPPRRDALPADVTAEKYYEWDSLRSGFRGELPEIKGLHIVDDLSRYLERKLFTLNGPNAVTGCFGYRKGYKTVQESLADEEIYNVVWQMMEEAGEMLTKRHGFTEQEMLEYRSFIMKRFLNPHIIDTCVRVAREPMRKLAANDRIVAAMNYANSFGIATPAYVRGIAEVLSYNNPDDVQSSEMQQLIASLGIRKALEQLSGIPSDSETAAAVEAEYRKIND